MLPLLLCQRQKPHRINYLPLGAQFPLPPPDGFPVVLGPFGGVHPPDLAIFDPCAVFLNIDLG